LDREGNPVNVVVFIFWGGSPSPMVSSVLEKAIPLLFSSLHFFLFLLLEIVKKSHAIFIACGTRHHAQPRLASYLTQ
jgi:hypothetical protein